jgi:hypothetical protein
MKPHLHAKSSVNRYGGVLEDYIKIHNYMDNTKSAMADHRHRAILHSSYGIFIVEDVFGVTITNSEGRVVSVRDIAEDHVIEDLGFIPSMENWLMNMQIQPWMSGTERNRAKSTFIKRKLVKEQQNEGIMENV